MRRQPYVKVAEVTGGSYFDAKTYNDFQNYWKQQVAAEIKTEQAAQCELHNTFFAELCSRPWLIMPKMIYMPRFEG